MLKQKIHSLSESQSASQSDEVDDGSKMRKNKEKADESTKKTTAKRGKK